MAQLPYHQPGDLLLGIAFEYSCVVECELPHRDEERVIDRPSEGSFWRRRGEDLTRLRGVGPLCVVRCSILSRTKALLYM